jgi:hypothetical protein
VSAVTLLSSSARTRPSRRLLLDPTLPDSDLVTAIGHLIGLFNAKAPLDWLRPDDNLALSTAMRVYDRLVVSSSCDTEVKVGLLSNLVTHVEIFRHVVSAVDVRAGMPHELTSSLPNVLDLPSEPVGIPQDFLDVLDVIVGQLPAVDTYHGIDADVVKRVRSLYPHPFNAIFPHNARVAQQLLDDLSPEQRWRLADDHAVLAAFLRYGLRFTCGSASPFPLLTRPEQFALVYPRLGKVPHSRDEFRRSRLAV